MDKKTIEIASVKAAEMVGKIPAEFRGYAFQVIFESILSEENKPLRAGQSSPKKTNSLNETNREELMEQVLNLDLDFSKHYSLINKGTWLVRAIVILYVMEKEFGIKGLTPPELATILKDKLRLPNVHAPNIGRALTGAMEFFVRSQEGQAYKYALSTIGLTEVEKLIGINHEEKK